MMRLMRLEIKHMIPASGYAGKTTGVECGVHIKFNYLQICELPSFGIVRFSP
jgi:hypothetical protein